MTWMAEAVDVYGYPLRAELAKAWQRAVSLAAGGDVPGAAKVMQAILHEEPGFVPAMVQGAHLLLAADRYRDAHAMTLAASRAAPAAHELAYEILALLRRLEEHAEAARMVAAHDWSGCGSAGLLLRAAAQLAEIGLYDAARTLLDLAERRDAGLAAIHSLRGTITLVDGDMAGARTHFRRSLQLDPEGLPQVRWMQSMHLAGEDPMAHAVELRQALRTAAPGTEGEAYLAFGLHNALHAAASYDEAWDALQRGCQAKRRVEPYQRTRQLDLFRKLGGMTLPPASTATGARTGSGMGLIFIVGMHRSGTTLLERVLAGHDGVADGGETYVFTACLRHAADHYCQGVIDAALVDRLDAAALAAAGERFREYARWRASGKAWLTEKLPSNFLNLGFILQALPEARVLHMRRDPMDTCFSNLRTYFGSAAAYSYEQRELAEYFRHYQALMRHWHAQAPGRILDVDYAAFVAEPEAQARRVVEFCGIEFQAEALAVEHGRGRVATASLADVRGGIRKDRGGVWRHYGANLQPLREALAPPCGADPAAGAG
jgi:tetratricopeptide (TPR) repeat protein